MFGLFSFIVVAKTQISYRKEEETVVVLVAVIVNSWIVVVVSVLVVGKATEPMATPAMSMIIPIPNITISIDGLLSLDDDFCVMYKSHSKK